MPINQNSKVIIFDDKYEEIQVLIETFQRQLIPSLYIQFDKLEEMYGKDFIPLQNVRLIFTDFISGDLSTGDPKISLGPIINAFDTTIDKNNGPFIVVVWSAHVRFKEVFEEMLKELKYKFILIELDKITLNRSKNFSEVQKQLKSKLNGNPFFLEFLQWESAIKNAASNILNLFSEKMDNSNYKSNYTLLSQASVGKSIFSTLDEKGKRKGFYSTMTNLLNDEMEKAITSSTTLDSGIDTVVAPTYINLNSKLLIDQSSLNCDENFPEMFISTLIYLEYAMVNMKLCMIIVVLIWPN